VKTTNSRETFPKEDITHKTEQQDLWQTTPAAQQE